MIVTLTGNNSYELQQGLKAIESSFIEDYGDMGLERLDCEEVDYDRIRESIESMPFLASKKMVVLRTPSAQKEFVEHAEDLLATLDDTTDVVIVEPQLDKRSRYYKFLKNRTEFKEFNELDEAGLASWMMALVKEKGGTLSSADARYIVRRVGLNQRLIEQELNKLVIYKPQITKETIDLLIEPTPQSTIFELIDAALSGDVGTTIRIYEEQRALKVEPVQIIALLAWQLHVLAVIVYAGDRSLQAIAQEAKINPYVIRKSSAVAKGLNKQIVKHLIHELHALDVRMKSESIDADEALIHYLTTMKNPH